MLCNYFVILEQKQFYIYFTNRFILNSFGLKLNMYLTCGINIKFIEMLYFIMEEKDMDRNCVFYFQSYFRWQVLYPLMQML